MTTALEARRTRSLEGEHRFLLPGIGWEGYEALLKLIGDGRTRVTYDRGDAELMSPLWDHEEIKRLIGRLVETVTEELNLPCEEAGSTTFRSQALDKGLEPDECYYLANADRVIGYSALRPGASPPPPPDLAVEIEITRGAFSRMGIYAALGVAEVWRHDGHALTIEVLQPDGTYQKAAASPALPMITPEEILQWVGYGSTMGKTPWVRELRAWVRDVLVPRHGGR
jgi:Uma2 family endonuclease